PTCAGPRPTIDPDVVRPTRRRLRNRRRRACEAALRHWPLARTRVLSPQHLRIRDAATIVVAVQWQRSEPHEHVARRDGLVQTVHDILIGSLDLVDDGPVVEIVRGVVGVFGGHAKLERRPLVEQIEADLSYVDGFTEVEVEPDAGLLRLHRVVVIDGGPSGLIVTVENVADVAG